jgi:adenine-specific DNA methylase
MNNGGIPNHGYTHWWTMFNPRQLLAQAQLLRNSHHWRLPLSVREALLGAFQQSIRYRNMFCFWDINYDKLVPHMSNNNYHPRQMLSKGLASVLWVVGAGHLVLMVS